MMLASLKKWAFRSLPAAVLGLFVAGGALTAAAGGPVFNGIHNGNDQDDYPTIQVAKSGQAWSPNTSAAVGDTVNVLVWVHNDVPDTTATNTHVKVNVPTTAGTSFPVTATISADNAASVSGTSTITVGSEAKLTVLTDGENAPKLLKNVNGSMTVVNWPAGTTASDVVSAQGVNLGSISGCWQYAQAIMLQLKVEGSHPAINTNKAVGIAGGAPFSTAVNGQPGDAAQYRIFVENTGDGTGIAPQVVDVLDAHTKYVPGTSFVRVKQNNNDYDQPIPDANIKVENLSNGTQKLTYQFTDMAPRPDTAFYLNFQVRLANTDGFAVGTTVIPNVANVSFANVPAVSTNQTTITVVRNPEPVVNFTLVKQVGNLTIGDNTWKDVLVGSAGPGDVVAFKLTVTNTGNTAATNVSLKDILPAGMTYVANSARLYNSTTGNDGVAVTGDAIVNAGYVFPTLTNGTPNQQILIFHAKLTDACSGLQTLTNKGQVIWQGAVKAEDTAQVIYSCERGLIIQKDVKTSANSDWKDDGGIVAESQVVSYRIIVTNNGNVTVNNPVLRDVLPSNVSYINNTLRIDGEVMSATVQNGFFNQGAVLTNFTPGMSKTITFDVKVNDCPDLGDTKLVNTAFVKADGVAEKSDTATITVRVNRPTLTF